MSVVRVALSVVIAALLAAAPASAAAPKWEVLSTANTTAAPGEDFDYALYIRNIGDAPTQSDQPVTFVAALPDGLTLAEIPSAEGDFVCSGAIGGSIVSCVSTVPVPPSQEEIELPDLFVRVLVDPAASGVLSTRFGISGGGLAPLEIVDPTAITTSRPGFGAEAFEVGLVDTSGAPETTAGGHPDVLDVHLEFNRQTDEEGLNGDRWPIEAFKSYVIDLPEGFVLDLDGVQRCTAEELAHTVGSGFEVQPTPHCPIGSQVGVFSSLAAFGLDFEDTRLVLTGPTSMYNMVPPPGVFARLGTNSGGLPGTIDVLARNGSDHGFSLRFSNASQVLGQVSFRLTLWGDPSDPSHDLQRSCPGQKYPAVGGPRCPAASLGNAYFRNPTACSRSGEGLASTIHLTSWGRPDVVVDAISRTHEPPGFPADPRDPSTPWGEEIGSVGCADVPARANLSAGPSTDRARSTAGLDLRVSIPNGGLANPTGIAASDFKEVEVTLPEGIAINPGRAEGIATCSPAQYAAEATDSTFGSGCPAASKIGTLTVDTPLLAEDLEGPVFVARPDDPETPSPGAENPFDSRFALYMVAKSAERGVIVKLSGEVRVDERGRLRTTVAGIPQQPFDSFQLHLDEGSRSPLVTPFSCGKYVVEAALTPWSDPTRTVGATSSFAISHGADGGACPPSPGSFKPEFVAGATHGRAGISSPFVLAVDGRPGDRAIAGLSVDLPPGLATAPAGVARCKAVDLAATERDRGTLASADPICPAASRVGTVRAGFGIGGVRTHVAGKVFLAGPYRGASASLATVIPVLVGPFDLGTIVQRSAIRVDRRSAAISLDARGSSAIPETLGGVGLHLSALHVDLDRRRFTRNPTSCGSMEVGAAIEATAPSGAAGSPVALASPFEVSGCRALDIAPRLSLALGKSNGSDGSPGLSATFRSGRGDANLRSASVRLPASLRLSAEGIEAPCPARSFRAERCDPVSVKGQATVFTPLLAKPLRGRVYLRDSKGPLPALVASLRGPADIDLVGRLVSDEDGLGIRFAALPDVPVRRLELRLRGGERGLLASRRPCPGSGRAEARFTGHGGSSASLRPALKCDGGEK